MKPTKFFAVIWTEEASIRYGVPKSDPIVTVEPKEDIKVNIQKGKMGRPKVRYADCVAIFKDIREAEAYREGNTDWKTVPIEIIFIGK